MTSNTSGEATWINEGGALMDEHEPCPRCGSTTCDCNNSGDRELVDA